MTDKEVWILAEHEEGVFKETAYGLLAEAKRVLKRCRGGRLCALVPGLDDEGVAGVLGRHGAERIYLLAGPRQGASLSETVPHQIENLARQRAPFLVLFAATSVGTDLAVRVAARLGTAVVTHCVDIKVGAAQRLEFVKAVADEMLYASICAEVEGPKIATVVPDVMEPEEPDRDRQVEIVKVGVPDAGSEGRLRVREVIPGDPKTIPLEEAEVVVAGGRGLGDPEGFGLVYELAEAVDGTVGGSRPVVDAGLLPFERQIGRTGKSTAPRLFIACGISGASEFTGGMDRAKQVIAINTDKEAPILAMADLGIVGDARQIIPEIVRLLGEQKRKQEKGQGNTAGPEQA